MSVFIAILVGLFLSYSNGANDNFKGVATLFGSGTTNYKHALAWGTLCTFLGSLAALVLAQRLIAQFSGKGLVPDAVIANKSFAIAVVLAAATTVMLATKMGIPISTTHSLTGALVGAGLMASPSGVNLSTLSAFFFAPLVMSPVLAILLAVFIYPFFRFIRIKFEVSKETCLCLGTEVIATIPCGANLNQTIAKLGMVSAIPSVSIGTEITCRERYSGALFGLNASATLNFMHFLSAGIVSFARGLNDTPKIAALILIGSAFSTHSPHLPVFSVALAMAIGGLIHAKKVAHTMALRVTEMNAGQGFTANLITSCIVIFASKLGLPVSTTHVSCGALFGIGAVTKQAHWKMIGSIFAAWITTLPVAALFGAFFFYGITGILT